MDILVVMPTMRNAKSLQTYIDIAPSNVEFLVLSQEPLYKQYERTQVLLDKDVYQKSWIFNRITKRNYGFLQGFHMGYDVIISLDDDCYPLSNSYFIDHLSQLHTRKSSYFNVYFYMKD